jgi:hypothetical protein
MVFPSMSDEGELPEGYLVDLRQRLLPSFRTLLLISRSAGRPLSWISNLNSLRDVEGYTICVARNMSCHCIWGNTNGYSARSSVSKDLTLAGTASCDPSASRGRRQPEAHTNVLTHLTPSITDKHLLSIPIVTQNVFFSVSAQLCLYSR